MDEELWDILEEGVGNLRLDEEGVALDRKAHTTEQKNLYKKHHLIRGILVAALPHKEGFHLCNIEDFMLYNIAQSGCATWHTLFLKKINSIKADGKKHVRE